MESQERLQRIEIARKQHFGGDYTDAEVAAILGKKKSTIQKYIREGSIICYQMGKEYRIPEAELLRFKDRLIEESRERARRLTAERRAKENYELRKRESAFSDPRLVRCPKCGCHGIVAERRLETNFFWGYLIEDRWQDVYAGDCEVCGYSYKGYDESELIHAWNQEDDEDQRLELAVKILNQAHYTVNHAERVILLRDQLGGHYSTRDVQDRIKSLRSGLTERTKVFPNGKMTPKLEEELRKLEADLMKRVHEEPEPGTKPQDPQFKNMPF